MSLSISVIIPTRERGEYLKHSIRTCTTSDYEDLEILVLDNASADDTEAVVRSIDDSRIRYSRSDQRLSMRNNFERGIDLARGDVLCFIGDDDGLFPGAVGRAAEIFAHHAVDAISASRAHYFWPDFSATRGNTALVPRRAELRVRSSKAELRGVLRHCDFYRLPCLYHGFVRRDAVQRVARPQARFFLSSIVDVYSAIALSMLDLRYAYSQTPLFINGASRRSNGVAHFETTGGEEKARWNEEDDLGFLPGFDNTLTLGGLIVESALRYCRAHGNLPLHEVLDRHDVLATLARERDARASRGAPTHADRMREIAGVGELPSRVRPLRGPRILELLQSYARTRPVRLEGSGVTDVAGAAKYLATLVSSGRLGYFSNPVAQLDAALQFAR